MDGQKNWATSRQVRAVSETFYLLGDRSADSAL
jgi:hypothetical protein